MIQRAKREVPTTAAALTIVAAAVAGAADIGVAPKKLVVVDKLATASKAKLVFVSKDTDAGITKGSGLDADMIEVTFSVGYANGSAVGSFVIPAGESDGTDGWVVNKATVAKYVNKAAPGGPTGVKVAVIKPGKLLKLVGKNLGDTPFDVFGAGDPAGSVFTAYCVANAREENCHCSEFSACAYKAIAAGTGVKLVCKVGQADPPCSVLGASSTTSTTLAPTTTTSTSSTASTSSSTSTTTSTAPILVTLFFEGLKPLAAGTQGAIAHGVVGEDPGTEPAPFREDGSQMVAHPFAHLLDGIYTETCSRDLFNFTTGDEFSVTSMAADFGATAPAPQPAALQALGITGDLHFSFSGNVLDYTDPDDYYFEGNNGDPATIQHSISRGGTLRIVEETAPATYQLVAEYTDFTFETVIDWNTFAVTGSASATVSGGSPNDFPIVGYAFGVDAVINEEGTTTEGTYGQFSILPGGGMVLDVGNP